jgi:predicted RNA-binding protein
MNTWLITEREENWLTDASGGFRLLGFPDRLAKRVQTIQRGDLLIVYVASGRSSIADMRRVLSARPTRRTSLLWDDIFPVRIETEPVITLKEENWVRIHALVDRLSFTKGKTAWGQCFRQPLRILKAGDADTLLSALKKAAAKGST